MSAPRNQHAVLDSIARKYAARKDTSAVRFALSSPRTGLKWEWHEDDAPRQFFLASITKLFTTAIVMQLRHEGSLTLDDPAAALVEPGALDGVHVLDGHDASAEITVGELLSHTSGIADYFEGKDAHGHRFVESLAREDRAWTPADAVAMARRMRPAFAPSAEDRALYSDTNFQILQMVIGRIDDRPYADSVAARIAAPLSLTDTYVFSPDTLDRHDAIAPIMNGSARFDSPLAMASFQADGGGVSTTADALRFLRAFMTGELFPRAALDELTATWRRIFSPMTYGMGIMRFALPRYMTLRPMPEMIGHSGASGTFLYYVPDRDAYVAGAVNQLQKRSLPYRALSELVNAA